ncbi:MAG TPA: MFS transporter [Novosphingobium sp.]|nr:MFS transporter [Novosphingobium sp.]
MVQADASAEEKAPRYAYYALLLLLLANFLNYIDRSVISIVAEHVKMDLELTDTQLGFLMGTAFAVFYGVAGIAMGRISDALSRTKLMAVALVIWSGLTAVSGAATSFAQLAAARIGVGLGESACSPCSQALLAEYFPARNRGTAISIYLLGTYVGGAVSLLLGALVLQNWPDACGYFPGNACELEDWRAAFLAVGLPGLILAVFVYRLREPPRLRPYDPAPVPHIVVREMSAAIPPLTLFNLANAGGRQAVMRNFVLIAVLTVIGGALTFLTGDLAQWAAVGVGAYSILTWGQVMKLRDRPLFALTFGSPTFASMILGGALCACMSAAIGSWSAPFAMRELGASPVTAGFYVGIAGSLGAVFSVPLGGWLADKWGQYDVRAPIWIALIGMLASIPFIVWMVMAPDLQTFAVATMLHSFFGNAWGGANAKLSQDLVMPRMRGAASACFTLCMTVTSAGFGPYTAGKVSQLTGSLSTGLLSILVVAPFAAALFVYAAAKRKAETPERLIRRAREAGEPIPA